MIRSLELAAFFSGLPEAEGRGGTVNAVKSSVMGRRRGDEEEECCMY